MFQKSVVEKTETQFYVRWLFFPRKSHRLWDNVEKYCRTRQATDDVIIRLMRFACWITKATDTHSECVILIAFAQSKWLRELVSMLLHTYIPFLFNCCKEMTSRWALRRTSSLTRCYALMTGKQLSKTRSIILPISSGLRNPRRLLDHLTFMVRVKQTTWTA
jgi:hypothetical protein